MKRLALTSLLLLTACASPPEQPLFTGHDAPEVVRFVPHRDVNGRVHMDVLYSDGQVRHGVHRLGDGPDIYEGLASSADFVNLRGE